METLVIIIELSQRLIDDMDIVRVGRFNGGRFMTFEDLREGIEWQAYETPAGFKLVKDPWKCNAVSALPCVFTSLQAATEYAFGARAEIA